MFARFRRTRLDPAYHPPFTARSWRRPARRALYTELGVPDTVEGRFEMVVAHTALVLRRLGRGDDGGQGGRGRGCSTCSASEMDDALRELGVKDTSVGKRMRKLGEAYYGRAAAYEAAIATADPDALAATLGRTVYGGEGTEWRPPALAAYMIASATALAAHAGDRVVAGDIAWPAVRVLPAGGPAVKQKPLFSRPLEIGSIGAAGARPAYRGDRGRAGGDRRRASTWSRSIRSPPTSISAGRDGGLIVVVDGRAARGGGAHLRRQPRAGAAVDR